MKNKSFIGLLLLAVMSLSACSFGSKSSSEEESKESSQESSVVSSEQESSSSEEISSQSISSEESKQSTIQSSQEESISSSQEESISLSSEESQIESSVVPSISSEETTSQPSIQSSEQPASSTSMVPSTSSNKPSSSVTPSSSEQPSSSYQPEEHVHVWATAWTSDADYHWHKCTATLGGAACVEIGDKSAHTWDEGTVTKEPGAYSTGIKTYKCTVCQYSKQEIIPATGGQEETGNFTFDETALTTPQEIHSANQKKYLNLGIQYYHITASDLSSCNASGNSNQSTPNKVTVSWDYTAPEGKTVSKYQLIYGQRSDLGDGYTIDGTTAKSVSFYNPYLGDNYFKVIANFSDGTKEASEIKVFKVDGQAPRNLSAGNMPNVRDMGGRTTYAGGKIKQGLIYRGAGNKFDNRSAVNDECKNVLTKQLKIKTEINVANSTGNNLNFTGMTVQNAYMDYGATPYSNLARNAERVRQVMDILAVEDNYPVFYHCRIGTDRTGITGMMIGGLLGIPFNEVFQDYCFSNFAPIDGQRYPNKPSDPNGDDPAKYIDEILAMPGANYQEQTYNALLSIGIPAETLNKIIDINTEGAKAELPGGVIGKGTSLSSTGTKKTSTDYTAPATYYELSSGKTATLTADFTEGEKDVVIYLGSTDSSDSTKLASCISLKIDGVEKTIVDKTLKKAGFGTTQQNKRTGYMFNLLGQYAFDEGQHQITITVKSGTFNFGTIAVFDHVIPE